MARGRPVKCPYCGGSETRPKGFRKTATMGPRRIRKCRSCKRRFTARQAGKPATVVMVKPRNIATSISNGIATSIATQRSEYQPIGELNHGNTNDLHQMRDGD